MQRARKLVIALKDTTRVFFSGNELLQKQLGGEYIGAVY